MVLVGSTNTRPVLACGDDGGLWRCVCLCVWVCLCVGVFVCGCVCVDLSSKTLVNGQGFLLKTVNVGSALWSW